MNIVKKFNTPEIEIIRFAVSDIITSSYETPFVPGGGIAEIADVDEMDLIPFK